MKLLDVLMTVLIIAILASITFPVLDKAYKDAKWRFLVAKSRHNSRLENALIDNPSKADDDRFEFLVSEPLRFK